ncbi:putative virus X resistance protein-like, coiled-coil [Helianthus debilis subsp. tardiflorus]
MAESVLSVVLPLLIEKLVSETSNSIARYKGIDAEIEKCQDSLKLIQRVLADASRKEITDDAVKGWLNDLQHLAYDIDDVLDGWATEAMHRESEGMTSKVRKLIPSCLYGVEAVGSELFGTGQAFPSLETLSFEDMRGWKEWSGAVFPRLQKLEIKGCPNLVEVTLEALPSLNDLKLEKCDSGVLRSLVEVASAVTKLEIRDISGLNDVVWGGVIEYLGAVEELKILFCDEIRYLVKSDADASKILVKLRKLEVFSCDNLVSIGEKEEEEDNCRSNLLTSLRILIVYYCKNMERCSCPDGIDELSVWGCSSMTVVSFPKGGQEKLKRLTIYNCRKLMEKEWEWGGQKTNNNRSSSSSSMPMLEHVTIYNWPNLKSIIELSDFVSLVELRISKCENLESFPDKLRSLKKLEISECPKLDISFLPDNWTSLEELVISDCPKLDASIPCWVWPPNLLSLVIGGLKKPFSEWGPQNFPTSLVKLTLHGGGEDEVIISCSEFSHLLPSSLTSLKITRFEKLESVSMGLQHLTSLKHLFFYNCPKMMDLPEMLLPSLLSLYISGDCPNLKERCSKKGSYWPLISHIPCLDIQYEGSIVMRCILHFLR